MIIATESVGRDENRNPISRIVKFLKPGGLVNIPCHLIDYVVTENGIAGPLEGLSVAGGRRRSSGLPSAVPG